MKKIMDLGWGVVLKQILLERIKSPNNSAAFKATCNLYKLVHLCFLNVKGASFMLKLMS